MNSLEHMIRVATEFSKSPGARHRSDGEFSGEEFLESLLEPRFKLAQDARQKLTIDLDGTAGYATSFLEAAFGGLARKYGIEKVLAGLEFISHEEPSLVDEITEYIKEAKD